MPEDDTSSLQSKSQLVFCRTKSGMGETLAVLQLLTDH